MGHETTKRIAEALGYKGLGVDEFGAVAFNNKRFNLHSPAIVLKMIEYLAKHGYGLEKVGSDYFVHNGRVDALGMKQSHDKSLTDCVIAAMEKEIGR